MSDPIVPTEKEQIDQEIENMLQTKDLLTSELEVSMASEGIVGDLFAAMNKGFKSIYAKVFGMKVGGVALTDAKPSSKFEFNPRNSITERNFIDFSQLEFDSMEGFTGEYAKYAASLVADLDSSYRDYLGPILKDYEVLLASLISNSFSRQSFEDASSHVANLRKVRQTAEADETQFWVKGSTSASAVKIGSVVPNLASLKTLGIHLKEIVSALNKQSLSEIKMRIERLNQTAEVFSEQHSQEKMEGITKAQVTNIATDLEEIACWVEYLGLVYYRSHVFLSACERIQDKIKNFA